MDGVASTAQRVAAQRVAVQGVGGGLVVRQRLVVVWWWDGWPQG